MRFAAACFASAEFAAQFRQRHGLDDGFSGALQRGEEQTFPAEDPGLDPPGELHVVLHGLVKGDDAAGVHLKSFTRRQIEFHEVAAAVNERDTRPGELFEDEALASEQSPRRFSW